MQSASCARAATLGSGDIVNDVELVYNDFGQRVTEYQSHSGAVNTMSTPSVQYGYADGSDNTVRLTDTTYPDGRELTCADDTGAPDALARVSTLIDDGTTILDQRRPPASMDAIK